MPRPRLLRSHSCHYTLQGTVSFRYRCSQFAGQGFSLLLIELRPLREVHRRGDQCAHYQHDSGSNGGRPQHASPIGRLLPSGFGIHALLLGLTR